MRNFIWLACLIYTLNGFGHIIIGTVLEPMVESYGIDYGAGGQLIMNQFLGFLGGVLLAPAIVKSLGRRTTILIALTLFAITQYVFSFLPDWNILLYIAPLGGAGMGILETVIAALIIGHLREKKATVLVLVEVFFGVGALLIPIISAGLIAANVWNASFATVAVIITIAIVLWFILPFGELDSILKKQHELSAEGNRHNKRQKYSRKQLPIITAGAFFFFMYVGTEMVLPNYLPTILSFTTDLGSSFLAMSITVFWLAMTFGRMAMTFVIDRIGYHKLFIISCVGQFLSLILFASTSSVVVSFVAIFLTGLLMGGIFSIGLLIINETSSGLVEWTTSLLVAMGGLGGAFLPKVVGELIDRFDITVTLWAIVAFAFILVFLMATIYHFRHRAKEFIVAEE